MLAGAFVQVGLWLRCSQRELAWLFTLGVALALLPWLGEMPVVYFLRGVSGDLSIATVIMIVGLYYRMYVRNDRAPAHWSQGLLLAGILGTLYACTLGYIHYDLYAWGFHRQWMLPGVLGLMLWAWHYNRALAVGWLVGVSLFALGLLPSRNLWDALFDPYLFLGSLWTLACHVVRLVLRRSQPTTASAKIQWKQAA
jgi:hypothetical protein